MLEKGCSLRVRVVKSSGCKIVLEGIACNMQSVNHKPANQEELREFTFICDLQFDVKLLCSFVYVCFLLYM